MGFGLNTSTDGSGGFMPVVKYDARAGRFFRVDRTQGAAGWETDNVDVTQGFTAVLDLANVQVGYAHFAAGQAPSWHLVPLGQALPAKPSDNHKQCFKLNLKLGKASGGDVREMASQAKVVIAAMDTLHTAYEAAPEAKEGKLPVVTLKGTTTVKSTGGGQTSTNYAPVFEIVKWVDRPSDLQGGSPVQTGTAQVSPAPAAAKHVEPPKAAEPAAAGDDWD